MISEAKNLEKTRDMVEVEIVVEPQEFNSHLLTSPCKQKRNLKTIKIPESIDKNSRTRTMTTLPNIKEIKLTNFTESTKLIPGLLRSTTPAKFISGNSTKIKFLNT